MNRLQFAALLATVLFCASLFVLLASSAGALDRVAGVLTLGSLASAVTALQRALRCNEELRDAVVELRRIARPSETGT